MTEVEALFTNWKSLLSGDTANNDEFSWTAGEINEKLKSVQPDIQDLEDTVAIVEQHPTKFSLAAGDLADRKRFIASVKQRAQVRASALARDGPCCTGLTRRARPRSAVRCPCSGNRV